MYTIKFIDLSDRSTTYITEMIKEKHNINVETIPSDMVGHLFNVSLSGIHPNIMPGLMIRVFHHIDQDQYREIIIN